jgi:hypothetical protein
LPLSIQPSVQDIFRHILLSSCWGAKTSTSMSVALSQSHILLAGRCRQQRFRVFQFFILYICRLDGCKFAVLIWEINFYSIAF